MDIVVPLDTLTFPSSSADLFGRTAPLFLEVGVGNGAFIHGLAGRRPDVNILGVDLAAQSVARSFRRLQRGRARGHATNARLIVGDASWILRNVIPEEGLQRVYVNFPDPWPRKKHHSRRLLQPPFLRQLSHRLAPDGDVLVTTDHTGFFEFVLSSIDATAGLRCRQTEPPDEVLETKWARKADSYHHVVIRREHADTGPFEHAAPVVELVETMYHAILRGKLPDVAGFERQTFHHRDGLVVLMDAYRPIEEPGLLFLVHVEEDGLSQEVLVEVRSGREGYVVTLRRFARPLNTRGLRAAVKEITHWLAETGMTIIHEKY